MLPTQPVATLIAAAVGALLGAMAPTLAFFIGRRRDHAQRLWERQIELYDDVLQQARAWELRREPEAREFKLSKDDYLQMDDFRRRFDMFGSTSVRTAYEEHAASHWLWASAAMGLADSYDQGLQAEMGDTPPHMAVSADLLNRFRALSRDKREATDAAHERLRSAIRGSAQQVPRLPWRWPAVARTWLSRAVSVLALR